MIYGQKITTTTKNEIAFLGRDFKSMVLTNMEASDTVLVDLWMVDQTGTSTTLTTSVVNEAYEGSVPGTSTTVTVDNGSGGAPSPTTDQFVGEKIYKDLTTNIGVCTSVGSTTTILFSNGLTNSVSNNDTLSVGTRFYFVNNVPIPGNRPIPIKGSDRFGCQVCLE